MVKKRGIEEFFIGKKKKDRVGSGRTIADNLWQVIPTLHLAPKNLALKNLAVSENLGINPKSNRISYIDLI